MQTDEALASRVAHGDETALRELLRRYERPLANFLYRHTGGRDVEDLYQETWLRVVRHAGRFDATRRFSTWLFQIANNLCRDRWRRLDARRRAFDALRDETLATGRSAADPPALPADAALTRRLETLPERLREVLVLRYYQDQSEAEISEILGIPRGTVKSRLHAAVRAARELVQEGDEHD